ncbi:MAG: bile acid:sodium symporter family protein [Myxococcales bacterium]|nr:bile acid:sodium symporter family protein [Myxococcales bacterium]
MHGFWATLRRIGFTLSVLLAVLAAILWPQLFQRWGGFETKLLIVPLIQVIMFGMGTTLSISDFTQVLKMPRPVLIGLVIQFGMMPVIGWGLAHGFGLTGHVAAGVILVGSCPGGVASNLITFLAKGNVALSVTMTACSTLVSPLLTPLLMDTLAGQFVAIPFWGLMISILKMVILPIFLGVLVNQYLKNRAAWLKDVLPVVSMLGIVVIIAIITSLNHDAIRYIGLSLILVVVIHNMAGYLLGYWGARLFRLSERDARTVAIEVGLQNSGMATGLAISALDNVKAGLAPAIFGPWMNMSGSVLASYWRQRPTNL